MTDKQDMTFTSTKKEAILNSAESSKIKALDMINHPSHYTDGKIEVIDFIEEKNLNFHRGNAVKYIARAGKKDPSKEVKDLQKAVWYLNREIERLAGKVHNQLLKSRKAKEILS